MDSRKLPTSQFTTSSDVEKGNYASPSPYSQAVSPPSSTSLVIPLPSAVSSLVLPHEPLPVRLCLNNPIAPSFAASAKAEATILHSSPTDEDVASPQSRIWWRHISRADMLPERPGPWLKFRLFMTPYQIFFILVITLNLIALILASVGHFPYADTHAGAILLGNLLCAIMMRNELFLRILYWLANSLLAKWPPLWVRLAVTSALQHVGGIHSGCAVSGLAWVLYKLSHLMHSRTATSRAVLAMGIMTNLAIVVSVISAFPWIRNAHHNLFERLHRFIGWLGIMFTWLFVCLGDCHDPVPGVCDSYTRHIIHDQQFWFVLGMSVFVSIPWAFTRKVEVDVEIPSKNVVVIRFNRGMQQGLLGRISRTMVLEYHAFGIVSEGTHSPYHYMICGVQGDFTNGLVKDPPKHLWTREIKFVGVSNTSKLYRRGIRICTGSGIGAALSTCLQDDGWFLIWIGTDHLQTFGPTIYRLIVDVIPPSRRILWDSKKLGGRPITMNLLEETYRAWGAEVVFITSNNQGNREMMLGCKERGIPAFGTLFDY